MNELVTNAVEHARTPLELLVSFSGASVLIGVRDAAVAEPQLQPFDRATWRGRGLQFVDALARRWSWTPYGDGKVVWAEMAIGDSEGRRRTRGRGELLAHTDEIDDTQDVRRASGDLEPDGPLVGRVRGVEQRGDGAGADERCVDQRDFDLARTRGGPLLVEAGFEGGRSRAVDLAVHADHHDPVSESRSVAIEEGWFWQRLFSLQRLVQRLVHRDPGSFLALDLRA